MGNNSEGRQLQSGSNLLVGFQNKPQTLCYSNAIFQVLLHHPVFVEIVAAHAEESHFIGQLHSLYTSMLRRRSMESVSTSKLMQFIEKDSAMFQRNLHQDSHQFYIWLMNKINDETKSKGKQSALQAQYFSKRITQTKCLKCLNVTEREEEEVDLSLTLPQPNVSLPYCIEQYSKVELMSGRNRFKCDQCNSLQEAQKRTLIKTLPNFLSIHLRRFKYEESKKSMAKLTWFISFPFVLAATTHNGLPSSYKLVGIIAHLGQGDNYGHYISYILIGKKWFCFNDEEIIQVQDYHLESLFGYKWITKCAYMLFYSLI